MIAFGLRSVEACPLCGEAAAAEYSAPRPNLYSEKLAGLLGITEADLLDAVENVQCRACSLIYKRRWFTPDMLRALFSDCVPVHPKGWDAVSGRFSPNNFQLEVNAYDRAIKQNDKGQIARYRRALGSIIDSIPELQGSEDVDELLTAIEQGEVETLRARRSLLERIMKEPTPYKRFSGFSASGLWNYLESMIGPIKRYAEVGCPLWGLIPRAITLGRHVTWLDRPEPNYWSTGCQNQGTHCSDHLINTTGAQRASWNEATAKKHDTIGAFQYLDHLERPGEFITELFQKANAAAIILDALDEPVCIQHLTGWTTDAMQWLAARHGCRVHDDFEEIRESGNQLFLLEKA